MRQPDRLRRLRLASVAALLALPAAACGTGPTAPDAPAGTMVATPRSATDTAAVHVDRGRPRLP